MKRLVAVLLIFAVLVALAYFFPAPLAEDLPLKQATGTIVAENMNTTPFIAEKRPTIVPVALQGYSGTVTVTVTAEMLNLRMCGSLKCGIVDALPKGTQMEFSNLCENGWAKLRDGWVYAKYIEPEVCK